MAPIERWYKKWEDLEVEQPTESREANEALLALNRFTAELQAAPEPTPLRQQRLLRSLSRALVKLEEGGEVERLLWQVQEVLKLAETSKLEEAVGACALLRDDPVDPRLVALVLEAMKRNVPGDEAARQRVAWAAAVLGTAEADDVLGALGLRRVGAGPGEAMLCEVVKQEGVTFTAVD